MVDFPLKVLPLQAGEITFCWCSACHNMVLLKFLANKRKVFGISKGVQKNVANNLVKFSVYREEDELQFFVILGALNEVI